MVRIIRTFSAVTDGTAIVLGVVCLVAALAGQGGRFSARLDVLTHFAPFWLLGSALTFGYGLVLASPSPRLTVACLGAAGAIAAALLILPELARPIRPNVGADAPHQIKLIQFNAWDENADVEATADWIAAQKPDLVLMQEVEPPIRRAMIARGFHYLRGMARSATFSRALPTYQPFQIPVRDWHILPSLSRTTFPSVGGAYSVVTVHLDWPIRRDQASQLSALTRMLAHYPADRLILTGDFNLTPWSFALRRLDVRLGMERRDRAIFSWPVRLFPKAPLSWPAPFLPIDHLYAGRDWRTVSIERGPRLGSDHYPIVARLALTE
jgi:endonuclease/exonuclease/phosphatase (EEP) superfamily protein YafD